MYIPSKLAVHSVVIIKIGHSPAIYIFDSHLCYILLVISFRSMKGKKFEFVQKI